MDGWFDISRKEEEEKRVVSALYHVISGGDDGMVNAQTPTQIERQSHHRRHPVSVLGGPPQVPLVFHSGEGSSSTNNNRGKKKIKSGKEYRGVRRRGNKWVAEIWDPHQGKVQWLSSFATAEEAARAYDRKAIEYRGVAGAFPYMNFPLEDYGYPSYNMGTNNNVQTTITQIAAGLGGPGQSSSTSAGTNESAPSHSSTTATELQDNINNNITAAEEDDPLLLLDNFDDYTLQQFMAFADSP